MSKQDEIIMKINAGTRLHSGFCRLRSDLYLNEAEIVHTLKKYNQPDLVVNDLTPYYSLWIGGNFFISPNLLYWYSAESIDFDFNI